jgi:hypothetical protein
MFKAGYAEGTADLTPSTGPSDGVIILDFGTPTTNGAEFSPMNNQPLNMKQISDAVVAFAEGYHYAALTASPALHATLVVGTNNLIKKDRAFAQKFGENWATLVNSIANQVSQLGCTEVTIAGGDDIETEYSLPATAMDWVNGYASVIDVIVPGGRTLFNYGSANGCPPKGSPPKCADDWTQEDIGYVSWQNSVSAPLPEIYYKAQAEQWQQLSLYSYLAIGKAMLIAGSLSEKQACSQTKHCPGTVNSPVQAWNQLYANLQSDPDTSQVLPWSTDIKWRRVK